MVLTPGFAPFEQYHRKGNQGPWTDVYGVAATLYFMIMGDAPPEANERVERDNIRLPSQVMITLPKNVEKGLMKGLAVKAVERFENIRDLLAAITPSTLSETTTNKPVKPIIKEIPPSIKTEIKLDSPANFKNFVMVGVVVFIAIILVYFLSKTHNDTQTTKSAPESQLQFPNTPSKDAFKVLRDVVIDTGAGLMWTRDIEIARTGMAWDDATTWVKDLQVGGYQDWRLPTNEELKYLIEHSGNRPADYLSGVGFVNIRPTWYWTSSTNPAGVNYAWSIHMNNGLAGGDYKTSIYGVWPVRSVK